MIRLVGRGASQRVRGIHPTTLCMFGLSLWSGFGCMPATYGTDGVSREVCGPPITQQNAQAQATTFMKTYLKDPLSAQYEWKTITPAWIHMQPTAFHPRMYGYALEALVNAKNSYGGYVGFVPFRFFFRDGALKQVAEFQHGSIWWQVHPPPP